MLFGGARTALGPIQARRRKTRRLFGCKRGGREILGGCGGRERRARDQDGSDSGSAAASLATSAPLHVEHWRPASAPAALPPSLKSRQHTTHAPGIASSPSPSGPPVRRLRRFSHPKHVLQRASCGARPHIGRGESPVTHAFRMIRNPHLAKQSQLTAWPGMAASLTRACMTPTETRGAQSLRGRSLVCEQPRLNYLGPAKATTLRRAP